MFMRKFGISYGSALNGITYLTSLGVLETHPNSGVTVSRRPYSLPVHERRCIGVLIRRNAPNPGLAYEALSEIQHVSAQYHIPLVPLECMLEDGADTLAQCGAAIIMTETGEELKALPRELPLVGLFTDDDCGRDMSIVNIDPYKAAQTAVEFFRGMDVRRVTVLTDPYATYIHRGRIFEVLWREDGGEIADFIAASLENVPDRNFPVRAGEGYLFTSDYQHFRYAVHMRKDFPRDAVVLGIDGKSLLDRNMGKFPTIAADWKEIGRIAFEEAMRRLDNPLIRPRRIYLAGRLSIPQQT